MEHSAPGNYKQLLETGQATDAQESKLARTPLAKVAVLGAGCLSIALLVSKSSKPIVNDVAKFTNAESKWRLPSYGYACSALTSDDETLCNDQDFLLCSPTMKDLNDCYDSTKTADELNDCMNAKEDSLAKGPGCTAKLCEWADVTENGATNAKCEYKLCTEMSTQKSCEARAPDDRNPSCVWKDGSCKPYGCNFQTQATCHIEAHSSSTFNSSDNPHEKCTWAHNKCRAVLEKKDCAKIQESSFADCTGFCSVGGGGADGCNATTHCYSANYDSWACSQMPNCHYTGALCETKCDSNNQCYEDLGHSVGCNPVVNSPKQKVCHDCTTDASCGDGYKCDHGNYVNNCIKTCKTGSECSGSDKCVEGICQECKDDTGGTCWMLNCYASRNSYCSSTHSCKCPDGTCNIGGKCVDAT